MQLVIDQRPVFGPIEEERREKMKSLCSPSQLTEKRFLEGLALHRRRENVLGTALDYAKSLDFSKSALRSSYLSHPLRVALFLLGLDPAVDVSYLVVALLHNVPETSQAGLADIERHFGAGVAQDVRTLLVDRTVPFAGIREDYYEKIFDAGAELTSIKLLDKMDNLFVLCLNPNEAVRHDYIAEVREMLLPFARHFHGGLGDYLTELLCDAERTGFSRELKDELSEYQKKQKTETIS